MATCVSHWVHEEFHAFQKVIPRECQARVPLIYGKEPTPSVARTYARFAGAAR
jgi:hypothetical protein